MLITYVVKTPNLITIASDTYEGWQETFAFLKSEGIEITAKKYSDYLGDTIPSDLIFYYESNASECPVIGPSWMF